MGSSQQLDIVKPHEIEETITNLMTKGFLGGAPMPVGHMAADPSMFDHVASGAASEVEGLSTHALSSGATIIPGPSEGGAFLDRPVGSYLAEHASQQSVEIEHFASEHGPTYMARRLADAGEMKIAGYDLNVIDFVPGGDLVQMVAGEKFDPSHMMLALAKGKMESEAIHGHLLHRETDHERAERVKEQRSSPSMADDAPSPGEAARSPGEAGRSADPAHAENGAVENDAAPTDAGAEEPAKEGMTRDAHGRFVPIDADTAARDLAILGHEHARNLDNAVSQWDEHDVHTEMTLHGRKVEIDTHFDAHNPDNSKERAVADEHVRDIPADGDRETVTQGSKMAFRSQVHAHLEATSRDEGMAR